MDNYLFEIQEDQQMRLDKYLAEQFPEQTRSYLQKLIKDGEVLVNGKNVKTGYQLSKGDEVSVNIPEPKELDVEPQKMDLDIVYEDDDVILINKPKGMVVHPAPGHTTDTLVNGLLYHCKDNLSGINGVARPGIVHRIDRDTTGILIVCKNDMSHNSIAAQLKEHSINRRYRALVHGNLKDDTGTIEGPIGRHPIDRKKMAINERNGKPAVTHYTVLERFGNYTLIECKLETGRTHQIRVHMTSIGHPLVGDEVYGPAKCPFKLQGQSLHAMVLGFVHPRTGEYMEFSADLPEYFEDLLRKLR
ncbi:MAG: RluA family pseudouridine synthase [Lachnospiraceae bacterium]|nr:RluA family pseudouridine synthase [Lachnospiraceae bacterium]